MNAYLKKWWGWGDPHKRFSLASRPSIFHFLQTQFDIKDKRFSPPHEKDIKLPESQLFQNEIKNLQALVGMENIFYDHATRLSHCLGKSTPDLIHARYKKREEAPDAVLFPKTESEVLNILRFCGEQKISVVPFGGGSSVLGGVSPSRYTHHHAVITLNLQKMNRVLNVDSSSHVACVQPGILGPQLEEELNRHHFTFGHFPQSFEFSTLGGWIATRGSGQNSSYYGNISDLVVSVKIATPQGIIQTRTTPDSSTGPSLRQLFIGSEGIFGVIVEAVIKIRPQTSSASYGTYLLPHFESGVTAIQKIKEENFNPLIVRLSDVSETQISFKMGSTQGGLKTILSYFVKLWMKFKKIKKEESCFLLVGFTGSKKDINHQKKRIRKMMKGSLSLGSKPGFTWHKSRFELPYLRDELLDYGILVDTFETATLWHNLIPLYNKIQKEAYRILSPKSLLLCHISHTYDTGASLYFTFLTSFIENPLTQWRDIKKAVTRVILDNGGTLSHHHGIGKDHRDFLVDEHGGEFLNILKNIKQTLDPSGIMNPRKLIQ